VFGNRLLSHRVDVRLFQLWTCRMSISTRADPGGRWRGCIITSGCKCSTATYFSAYPARPCIKLQAKLTDTHEKAFSPNSTTGGSAPKPRWGSAPKQSPSSATDNFWIRFRTPLSDCNNVRCGYGGRSLSQKRRQISHEQTSARHTFFLDVFSERERYRLSSVRLSVVCL